MSDILNVTGSNYISEPTEQYGPDVNTGALRRKYNFGDKVSELSLAQDPFFRFVSMVSKKPTDDPTFKFTEKRESYTKRYVYINKHDNYKVLKLSLDHMTTANKTSLLTFSNTVTNRKPFIYSEDGVTGPLHYVRLAAPLTFKQVAPGIWSCQVVMRQLIS